MTNKRFSSRTTNYVASQLHIVGFTGGSQKAIWDLILAYCNNTEVGGQEMAKAFGIGFGFFKGLERIAYILEAEILRDVSPLGRLNYDMSDAQEKAVQRSAEELKRHQKEFSAGVRWLCSPKNTKPAASRTALERVMKSGKFHWGRFPFIDNADEAFIKYFESHGLTHLRLVPSLRKGGMIYLAPQCKHLIDPLCAFLLHECAFKAHEELPVKTCTRPGCGRLFLQLRRTRKFCSDDCRVRTFWTPEKRSQNRRRRLESRLKRLPPGPRRLKEKKMLESRAEGVLQ